MRLLRRTPAPARNDYMTPAEHYQEAERLAWVIDDVIQSGARRTAHDLIVLARLHLELAQASFIRPALPGQAGAAITEGK